MDSSLPPLPVPDIDSTCSRYLATVRPFLNDLDYENTVAAVNEFKKPGGQAELLQTRLLERAKHANQFSPSSTSNRSFGRDLLPTTCSLKKTESSETLANYKRTSGPGFEIYATKKDENNASVKATANNWLIDWWNEYSYLAFRDPVVVNVSYFFVFPDDKLRRTAVPRAASLVAGAMEFRQQLLDGTLSPDMNRTTPMCMRQYDYMFNTCRIPVKPSDCVITYDPEENHHIAVVRNNRFFVFDAAVDDESNGPHKKRLLTVPEIESQLQKIVDITGEVAAPAIGVLTCDNRDIWTVNRDTLLKHDEKNAVLLRKLESASFLLCLDDGRPVTREEVGRSCWHGDGENRWFDTSLQFIVFENGKAGLCGEHSLMDATPTARMCDFVIARGLKASLQCSSENAPSADLPTPTCLDFAIPPSILNEAIPKALASFRELVEKHDLRVLAYRGYGKEYIKTIKVSPDAFAQMAIQLAWYKMRGTWVSTYESAGMRGYSYGRTETCRSVSDESVEFVIAMDQADVPAETKAELARRAISGQSAYMVACLNGKGIDRHLLGLRLSILPHEPTPEIFTDTTYALTSHWTLSTSQIPSEYFEGYGWGEVVTDGFGVAYMVKPHSLHFNVTGLVGSCAKAPPTGSKPSAKVRKEGIPGGGAYEDMPTNRVRWFKHYLEESLEDLRAVFDEAAAVRKSQGETEAQIINKPIPPVSLTRKPTLRAGSVISLTLPPTSTGHPKPKGPPSPGGTITRNEPGLSLAYPERRSLSRVLTDEGERAGVLAELGNVEFDLSWKKDTAKNFAERLKQWWKSTPNISPLSPTNSNPTISE